MPSLERRRLQCYIVLMLTDWLAIAVGFYFAGQLKHDLAPAITMAEMIAPIFLVSAIYGGAYSWGTLESAQRGAAKVTLALAASLGIVLITAFYFRSQQSVGRLEFTLGAAISLVLLVASRVAMRHFVRWHCGAAIVNQLVIDDGGPQVHLPNAVHISAKTFRLIPSISDPSALDRLGIAIQNADRVIVSSAPERKTEWATVLKGANIAGEVVHEDVMALGALGARTAGGQGVLQVSSGPLGVRDRIAKRLLDFTISLLAVTFFAPLLCLVALLIKIEDGGPVFFVQRRVGRGNRFFSVLKFRSMSVNKEGVHGGQSASRGDQRVTRVGSIIRRTSIDELPQLINVLLGDMSLVGPRPHALGSLAGEKLFWEVDPRYWQRHALKPGLTGLAQVRGYRGATDTEEDLSQRLNADLEYLNGWSLGRDIWIIMQTFTVLIHDRAF